MTDLPKDQSAELPNANSVSELEALEKIVARRLYAASLVGDGDYAAAVRILGDTVKWSDDVAGRLQPSIALRLQQVSLHSDLGSAYAILGDMFRAGYELTQVEVLVRAAAECCPCGKDSPDRDCPVPPEDCGWLEN